ncbi:hypothetical protein ACROYT_G034697 [Oculina patagonica]
MNRLKRSLSLRSSKRHIPESVRPQIWENDSYKVRNGGVSFPVKYVGSIEVTESRGTQVCAEAFRKLKEVGTGKKKRMQLLVTADCVRVVDEQTKSLVIDQTIEKVSFCTPDPSNERVFSYICRDGTTRRWICHCFIALRDTGERLSHAVGCAFTACLQRKQKAQALQQQHKEAQQPQQQDQRAQPPPQEVPPAAAAAVPTAVAATPSAASTTPIVNGSTPSNLPPQQPSPGQIKTTATMQTSTTAPIAAAAVPSSVTTPPMKNGTVVTGTQQLPSPGQPKQSNAATPILKPPPSVARPRPQPFNPSPFTRHMSLRYRSNPLSFMPLRGDTSGYETLSEEPSVPQLPPALDTLMLTSNTPAQPAPVPQPTATQTSAPNQPNTMYNGMSANPSSTMQAPNTLLNLSRGGSVPNAVPPLQPLPVQSATPQVNGVPSWSASTQQQRQKPFSDAEMWLASASADTTQPVKPVQPNQGLLTTVNPFAETASQIDALSNAWTRDFQATLPNSQPQGNTTWSSSPWASSSSRPANADEEFASFFATRQTSPPARAPLTKKDSNPFSPQREDQVFWV